MFLCCFFFLQPCWRWFLPCFSLVTLSLRRRGTLTKPQCLITLVGITHTVTHTKTHCNPFTSALWPCSLEIKGQHILLLLFLFPYILQHLSSCFPASLTLWRSFRERTVKLWIYVISRPQLCQAAIKLQHYQDLHLKEMGHSFSFLPCVALHSWHWNETGRDDESCSSLAS